MVCNNPSNAGPTFQQQAPRDRMQKQGHGWWVLTDNKLCLKWLLLKHAQLPHTTISCRSMQDSKTNQLSHGLVFAEAHFPSYEAHSR